MTPERIYQATYQPLFFESGDPSARKFCSERGLDYPPLEETGVLDNPSVWCAGMRDLMAERGT